MRIAFFVSTFPKISETFITNQVTTLIDAGHDVKIFAFNRPDEIDVHEEVEQYNLTERTSYIPAPKSVSDGLKILLRSAPSILGHDQVSVSEWLDVLSTGKRAPRQYGVIKHLLSLESKESFDVFHAHFGPVGESIRPAAEILDMPLLVSFYGRDASKLLNQDPNRYDRLFETANRILVLSDEMRNRLENVDDISEKIDILPLMIDADQYPYCTSNSSEGLVKIVTVARLVEKKGIEYAVDAVKRVTTEHSVQFSIVGDGPERETIEEKIDKYNLRGTIEVLGYKDHQTVKSILSRSDIFVLPSVTAADGDCEGTPTVILEAEACGLPILSTTHAGIPEIVKDGETGYLVPERDVDSLEGALRRLLDDPSQWPVMGKHGRQLVEENHSPEKVVKQLESIYVDVV